MIRVAKVMGASIFLLCRRGMQFLIINKGVTLFFADEEGTIWEQTNFNFEHSLSSPLAPFFQ